MKASVSVIIPNYNGARFIEATIKSCIAQGDALKEIIVVDDGSTDSSWELLETLQQAYPEHIKIYKNPAKGGNHARNFGFEQSDGDFIQWLDSDDTIAAGKFDTQLQYFESHADTDVVYSDFCQDFYDEKGAFVRRETSEKAAYDDYLFELVRDNWSPNNSYLLRRRVAEYLHANKGWNPDTPVLQDREYILKAAIKGFSFGYASGLFAVYNRFLKIKDDSVSAAKLAVRNKSVFTLANRFKDLIRTEDRIDEASQALYFSYLDTQILFASALTPGLALADKPAFKSIRWSSVGGIRTKLKMFMKWIE